MTRFPSILAAVALLAVATSPIHAANKLGATSLDGRSFEGRLRLTGIYRWISGKDTLIFKKGTFSWAGGIADGYDPAHYRTTKENGNVIFTVRSKRDGGDYVDWSGVYDGHSLSNVRAVWTRKEKDFGHDLFLPPKVTFTFTQK